MNLQIDKAHNYYNEQDGTTEALDEGSHFDNLASQFASLPMAIFADVRSGRLTHRDVCLYVHFICKQGSRSYSYWGIERLAELTGTYPTSIKQSIRRLVSCGHLARLPGPSTTRTVCLTRLDPQKGSKRILIKDKSLAAFPQKSSTSYAQGGRPWNSQPRNARGSESVGDRRSAIERDKDALVASMRSEN